MSVLARMSSEQMRASTRIGSIDVLRRLGAILPTTSSREPQLGMDATFPVNDEDDFTRLRIHIDDDFVDQGADQAFLEPDIGMRAPPHGLQVRGQLVEFLARGTAPPARHWRRADRCAPRSRGRAARPDSSAAPIRRRPADSRDRSHRIASARAAPRSAPPPGRASTPAGRRPADAPRLRSRPRRPRWRPVARRAGLLWPWRRLPPVRQTKCSAVPHCPARLDGRHSGAHCARRQCTRPSTSDRTGDSAAAPPTAPARASPRRAVPVLARFAAIACWIRSNSSQLT